ncbi:MAG: tetratricopeptide repeat protein [Syntrophales bacterium]
MGQRDHNVNEKSVSEQMGKSAERHLQRGEYRAAIDLYEKLIERHPGDDSFVLALAWAYHDGGFMDEAVGCFEKLLEKELQRKIFTGFAFDELVRIFKRDGHYDRLVMICERAMAAQPEDYALMGDLGEAYLKTGGIEKAVVVFRKMTDMEPEDATAFCRLGNALVALESFAEAEAAYERAAAIEPTAAGAYYSRLSEVYRQAGHHDLAVRALERCIRENADEPAYHLLVGDIMVAKGDIADAFIAYERAVKLRPNFTGAYFNRLGNTLSRFSQYEKAVTAFQKAITAEPDNPFYILYLNAAKGGQAY